MSNEESKVFREKFSEMDLSMVRFDVFQDFFYGFREGNLIDVLGTSSFQKNHRQTT